MRVRLYAKMAVTASVAISKLIANNIKMGYLRFQMHRVERTHGTTREQRVRLVEWREKIGGFSEKEKEP